MFGVANVTMPHKLSVHKFWTQQTIPARLIGAINTLLVRKDVASSARLIDASDDNRCRLVKQIRLQPDGELIEKDWTKLPEPMHVISSLRHAFGDITFP